MPSSGQACWVGAGRLSFLQPDSLPALSRMQSLSCCCGCRIVRNSWGEPYGEHSQLSPAAHAALQAGWPRPSSWPTIGPQQQLGPCHVPRMACSRSAGGLQAASCHAMSCHAWRPRLHTGPPCRALDPLDPLEPPGPPLNPLNPLTPLLQASVASSASSGPATRRARATTTTWPSSAPAAGPSQEPGSLLRAWASPRSSSLLST